MCGASITNWFLVNSSVVTTGKEVWHIGHRRDFHSSKLGHLGNPLWKLDCGIIPIFVPISTSWPISIFFSLFLSDYPYHFLHSFSIPHCPASSLSLSLNISSFSTIFQNMVWSGSQQKHRINPYIVPIPPAFPPCSYCPWIGLLFLAIIAYTALSSCRSWFPQCSITSYPLCFFSRIPGWITAAFWLLVSHLGPPCCFRLDVRIPCLSR